MIGSDLKTCPGRNIRTRIMPGAIRRTANQHEAPVAIAAIDIAMLVNLQEHARVAECGGNIAGSVAGYAGLGRADDLWWLNHCADLAAWMPHRNIGRRAGKITIVLHLKPNPRPGVLDAVTMEGLRRCG